MFKKGILTLITLITVVCMFSTSVFAASYTLSLTANGETELYVAQGDEVTVKLFLINNEIDEDENYDFYSMQDYVRFDREFFEFVDGSITVRQYASGGGLPQNLFGASAICFDAGAKDRVFVNRGSTTAVSVAQTIDVLTFKLRVLANEGSSTLTHDTIEVLDEDGTRLTYDTEEAVVIIGTAPVVYHTISASAGTGGTISPSGAIAVEEGTNKTFTISANSGYKISKVEVDGTSVGAVSSYTFESIDDDHTIEAFFSVVASSGIISGTITPTPPADDEDDGFAKTEVIVDGEVHNIASSTVSEEKTEVVIDHDGLQKEIEDANHHVIVKVETKTDKVETKIMVKDVEVMAENDMDLTVIVNDISYIVPPTAVDTDLLKEEFPGVETSEIPFVVTVSHSDDDKAAKVEAAVKASGAEVVGKILEFKSEAVHGGKTIEVKKFNDYVERSLEITKEQAGKVTTAVVYENDGSLRHVPTYVHEENGKYYARINSLTNSSYVLISSDKAFADAKGTWYEETVNEMANRKVVNGRSDVAFEGDAPITRAEFAAIIVRALGLPSDGTENFADVVESDWFDGAVGKAQEYGIVSGKGEGKFEPNALITREEAMTMIARAAKITGLPESNPVDLSTFVDADKISGWATEYVQFNVDNSLIVGNEAKELAPNGNITRAETATVVLRLLRNAGLVDIR